MVAEWNYNHPDEPLPEDYWDNPEAQKYYENAEAEAMNEWDGQKALYVTNEFLEWLLKDKIRTSAWEKTSVWDDIVDKATRYYNEGRVELLNNMPDHSIANVNGDTGNWQTEIWRQDPERPNALSGWSCTCPWGQVSWGRTRIWKQYEGRPCAHTVVTTWEAQRRP
jgi:hypothetical protein